MMFEVSCTLTGDTHMLAITKNGTTQQRKPACARCGGTGYVYLWSVAASGKRRWYCDRSGCKQSWSDADPIIDSVTAPVVVEKSVLSVAARLTQRPLHAARNGAGVEFVPPRRSPISVVAEGVTAAREAPRVGGEALSAMGLD
jgi:hypothetical protein